MFLRRVGTREAKREEQTCVSSSEASGTLLSPPRLTSWKFSLEQTTFDPAEMTLTVMDAGFIFTHLCAALLFPPACDGM